MADEAPIIYGLEFPARALAAQVAETEIARFFIGTQSLKFDNQIHLLEYDEENSALLKTVFLHNSGEVWHLNASPTDPNIISTCFNQVTSDGKCEMRGAIWKLPGDQSCNNETPCDDSMSTVPSLELVAELDAGKTKEEFKSIIWEPIQGKKLVSLTDSSFYFWDLENYQTPIMKSNTSPEQKGRPKFTSVRWNPHHNCNLVATAIDSSVRSWDIRTMKMAWAIDGAHGQLVRELDFNPNKQYFIVTCGDDCETKFWDVRNSTTPLTVLSDHSHWVWSARYNSIHDQLVLTSSSDSRVILSRVISISSEPHGRILDDDDDMVIRGDKDISGAKQVTDGVVSIYDEHEDSVYAAEWSTADPWLFASLSYDGRVVVNKVPRSEKYRILL